MLCPKCGRDCAQGCIYCPYCLQPLSDKAPRRAGKGRAAIIAIAVIALLICAVLGHWFVNDHRLPFFSTGVVLSEISGGTELPF